MTLIILFVVVALQRPCKPLKNMFAGAALKEEEAVQERSSLLRVAGRTLYRVPGAPAGLLLPDSTLR